MKKIIAALAAALIFLSPALTAFTASAAEGGLDVVFEENFEEYEKDVNVNSTAMPQFFICEYNTIGDGMISVQEKIDGNLELKSHVFTHIYTALPVTGAYEFSLKIFEAQGQFQSGVFVRAPKYADAYYEGDGYPDISACQSGIYICPHDKTIGVTVKTYDAEASTTSYLANHRTNFEVPGTDNYPYDLKITDDGERISLYCNDILVCSIVMSDPGHHYENHTASASPCFGTAVLYDADGKEIAKYKDPLLQSDASIFGWSTRASDMHVDNIVVKAEKTYKTQLLINRIPSKITAKNYDEANPIIKAAREAYDSLTEAEQASVINAAKLVKAEAAAAKFAPDTTAEETVPPDTDAGIQTENDVTEPPAATDAPTESVSSVETTAEEAQTTAGNDSLTIWIIAAAILAMIGATAGFIVHKVRK